MTSRNIKKRIFIIVFIFAGFRGGFLYATILGTNDSSKHFTQGRIVFYNLENFFYPTDDSIGNDEDFTPEGIYYWGFKKYYNKLNKAAKLILAIGGGVDLAGIGLCEIENRKVLEDLVRHPMLKHAGYKIIHKESNDYRGIDVAFLYNPRIFIPEYYEALSIHPREENYFRTRDILYIYGSFKNSYPCHIFINHWPSRRGGKLLSDKKRINVSKILKNKVDTLFARNPEANIVIMGDFNDEPADASMKEILGAGNPADTVSPLELYNLMYRLHEKGEGTYYRKNNFYEASLLDQIIVSHSILKGKQGLSLVFPEGKIYKEEFLINQKNGLPFRTYQGLKYLGGVSDHFPVYIDINFKK